MMWKIIWTDHVRNEEVLQKVKEERGISTNNKRKEGRITGCVTSSVGTAFSYTLLRER